MKKSEYSNERNNLSFPDDGSSIFAGKNENNLELQPYQRASEYTEAPLDPISTSNISDAAAKRVRDFLVSNPGLLQDDVAKALKISLFALEACKTRPEEVSLSEDDYKFLASTGLGKVVVRRRSARIEQIKRQLRESRENSVPKKTEAQIEAAKKSRITRDENKKKRNSSAKRRGIQNRLSIEKKEQLRKQKIEEVRTERIATIAAERTKHFKDIHKHLFPSEIDVVSCLHVDHEVSAEANNKSVTYYTRNGTMIRRRLNLRTREDLALWALENGVQYKVATPPSIFEFTLRERNIALNLNLRNDEIAQKLGITISMFRKDLSSLHSKSGAKNRTELFLMAHIYHFEPVPEEIEQSEPDILDQFTKTEYQKEILKRIHLPGPVIARELGKSEPAVLQVIKTILKISETKDHVDLASKVYEAGYKLPIRKLEKPLHELLSKSELACVRLIHLTNNEIAEQLGMSNTHVKGFISAAKKVIGARSRAEIKLLVQTYDTGESKEKDTITRLEKFFNYVGIKELSKDDTKKLIVALTEQGFITKQHAESITPYFLTNETITWEAIGVRHRISGENARRRATAGLKCIRAWAEEEVQVRTNPDYLSERQKAFCMKLGIEPTRNVENLLKDLNPQERTVLDAYYFSRKEKSWNELGKEYRKSESTLRGIARSAIERIKQQID